MNLPPNPSGTCVAYWIQRAQRAHDNPALDHAIHLANRLKKPVIAIFGLTANYPSAQRRHYRFLVDALPEIELALANRGVAFIVKIGSPPQVVLETVRQIRPAALIADENPIRVAEQWRAQVAESIQLRFETVDADVVVPTALFPNEEYAARTLRPKIMRVLDQFLIPSTNPNAKAKWRPSDIPKGEPLDPIALLQKLNVAGAREIHGYHGGPAEAERRLDRFLRERLPVYHTHRNQAGDYATSELSAHLHFGHISPITIALKTRGSDAPKPAIDAFIEELVVRRELAINFVARNPNYDRLDGCPNWARQSLAKHAGDPRPFIYSRAQLEAAETHDEIWNAAQLEMVLTGRMHNYLRMYWAKKILEWSPDPDTAFQIALDLNDRYEMDGRDPNGYTGVAWAIGGKHDRPWPERPIFGTVRFMSYDGIKRKIDAPAYIRRVHAIQNGQLTMFE